MSGTTELAYYAHSSSKGSPVRKKDGLGLRVRTKAGIRIFHDHLPGGLQNRDELEALLKVEKEMRGQEPFASLGQHVHLVCEWAR